jgi:hypothetical protein
MTTDKMQEKSARWKMVVATAGRGVFYIRYKTKGRGNIRVRIFLMPNPAATYNIGGSRVEEVMF